MSSDAPPPPKAKPGSLRDRIAAFEKKPDTSAPAPPAPRPKPGHVQWKPRTTSPPPAAPSGTAEASSTTPERRYVKGGMSASDAKESIGAGGSLKARMAALQGRGGFGAPVPAAPPKPVGEKPKWKPPPVVHASEDDGEVEHTSDHHQKPELEEDQPTEASVAATYEAEEKGAGEDGADPEEEERQRRAALAARMARLGGARVGMGPPVFGIKPQTRKVETPKEEPKEVEKVEEVILPSAEAESSNQTDVHGEHLSIPFKQSLTSFKMRSRTMRKRRGRSFQQRRRPQPRRT